MNDLQASILTISKNHRCVQSAPGAWNLPLDYCFFGVPQSEFFGWTILETIPVNTKGFHFYLGGEPEKLMADFSQSNYPAQLEKLAIGNSSYAVGKHQDYRNLLQLLIDTQFPNLKKLDLGIWELFCNAHCLYGKLGDITRILKNSPKIEKLGLYGQFELTTSLLFSSLKDITVILEDCTTGSNGGFISHMTLSHLLESEYPTLEAAFIDLNCQEDQYGYQFPDKFLQGQNLPKLKKLEITGGFLPKEKERLLASPIGHRSNVIYYMSVS